MHEVCPWLVAGGTFAALAAIALRWRPAASGAATLRNRIVTAGVVAAVLLASRGLWPDSEARAGWLYLITITLGYGHLIGGAVFSRSRMAQHVPAGVPPRLLAAFFGVGVLSLFAAYTVALSQEPSLFIAMLGISAWHTIENDLCLRRAYADEFRIGPIPRALDHHLIAVGCTALFLLAGHLTSEWQAFRPVLTGTLAAGGEIPLRAACVVTGGLLVWRHRARGRGRLGALLALAGAGLPRDAGVWISLSDLFVLATLTHLVSWLVFFGDRMRLAARRGMPDIARATRNRLLWVHVPPALFCAALLLAPAHPGLEPLRIAAFSPGIYLYWSVVHVFQTAVVRGVEPVGVTSSSASPVTG